MGLLLDIGYLLATLLALPWFIYRMTVRGDWRGLPSRLGIALGNPVQGSIWLHGSSAGEISMLRPLIDRLRQDMPDTPLVISAYSSTGYATARKAYPEHRVIFFPIDLSVVVSRFLRRFNPRLIVILESEFWPNFLIGALRREIPVAVLNGKMSPKSCRIHARTRLVPLLLRRVSLIAVQSHEHASRLLSLGIPREHVRVTGNMKYDMAQPPQSPGEAPGLRESLGYGPDDVVIIGGSLHGRENDVLVDSYQALAHQEDQAVALIIVPRYPADAGRIEQAIEARGCVAARKTEVDQGKKRAPGAGGVLVVDTVGELRTLYAVADIAFVGGSLFYRGSNKGGHNLMEPAILGVPVLFGPYNFSFKETAQDLLAAEAGVLVRDGEELEGAMASLVGDPQERRALGARARNVVLEGQGATRRNYELLVPLLAAGAGRLPASASDSTMPPAVDEPDSR